VIVFDAARSWPGDVMPLAPHAALDAYDKRRALLGTRTATRLVIVGVGRIRASIPLIEQVERFPEPIELDAGVEDDVFEIDEARFDALVTRGLASRIGLAEAASPFIASYDEAHGLNAAVLARCAGRCELTGIGDRTVSAGVIRPVPDGGAAHVSNMLALTEPLWPLFTDFAIAIAQDDRILADLSAVPPDIRAMFNADGRLRRPANGKLGPRDEFLAWHRAQFLRRIRA